MVDEDIVPPASLAVDGDADTVDLHQIGKGLRSELRAPVGIEDLRRTLVVDGFLDRFQAEHGIQGVRYP